MKMAYLYPVELLDRDDNILMHYVKKTTSITYMNICFRHIDRKGYRVYVHFESHRDDIAGFRR